MRRAALPGLLLAWIAIILLARAGVEAPGHLLGGLTVLVASLVKSILEWGGMTVSQYAAVLFLQGGFGYVVAVGCTGIVPAAVIGLAILASPARPAARVLGLLVTIPLVLLLNLVRLVHLFYLGVYAPESFALAHEVVWEGALVICAVGLWFGWWTWASRIRGAAVPTRSEGR